MTFAWFLLPFHSASSQWWTSTLGKGSQEHKAPPPHSAQLRAMVSPRDGKALILLILPPTPISERLCSISDWEVWYFLFLPSGHLEGGISTPGIANQRQRISTISCWLGCKAKAPCQKRQATKTGGCCPNSEWCWWSSWSRSVNQRSKPLFLTPAMEQWCRFVAQEERQSLRTEVSEALFKRLFVFIPQGKEVQA